MTVKAISHLMGKRRAYIPKALTPCIVKEVVATADAGDMDEVASAAQLVGLQSAPATALQERMRASLKAVHEGVPLQLGTEAVVARAEAEEAVEEVLRCEPVAEALTPPPKKSKQAEACACGMVLSGGNVDWLALGYPWLRECAAECAPVGTRPKPAAMQRALCERRVHARKQPVADTLGKLFS